MATAAEATTATPTPAHDGIVVSDPPIVDITALRKSYGTNEVLKGIDLKVQKGEVIAIIGKSGSGKSTLLRCVNGLEQFQEGALSVNGKKLLHDNPAAMRELGNEHRRLSGQPGTPSRRSSDLQASSLGRTGLVAVARRLKLCSICASSANWRQVAVRLTAPPSVFTPKALAQGANVFKTSTLT